MSLVISFSIGASMITDELVGLLITPVDSTVDSCDSVYSLDLLDIWNPK